MEGKRMFASLLVLYYNGPMQRFLCLLLGSCLSLSASSTNLNHFVSLNSKRPSSKAAAKALPAAKKNSPKHAAILPEKPKPSSPEKVSPKKENRAQARDEKYEFATGTLAQPREPGYPTHGYRASESGLKVKMDPEWKMRVFVDARDRIEPYGPTPTREKHFDPTESWAPTFAFERKF